MAKHRLSHRQDHKSGLYSVLYDNFDITGPKFTEVYITDEFRYYAQVRLQNGLCTFIDERGRIKPWKTLGWMDISKTAEFNMVNNLYALKHDDEHTKTFFKYKQVKPHKCDRAAIQGENKLWGYIDEDGNEIIEMKYLEACTFENNIAKVQGKTKKWGYIYTNGKVAIKLRYSSIGDFHKDIAKITDVAQKLDSLGYVSKEWLTTGYINIRDVKIIPCIYKSGKIECEVSENGEYISVIYKSNET